MRGGGEGRGGGRLEVEDSGLLCRESANHSQAMVGDPDGELRTWRDERDREAKS